MMTRRQLSALSLIIQLRDTSSHIQIATRARKGVTHSGDKPPQNCSLRRSVLITQHVSSSTSVPALNLDISNTSITMNQKEKKKSNAILCIIFPNSNFKPFFLCIFFFFTLYFFVFLEVLETSFFFKCLGIFSCRFSRFASLTASLCSY